MRVALLTRAAHPLHPPGGLERAVFELARHLRGEGIETVLLTRSASAGCDAAGFPGEVVTVPYRWLPLGAHGRVIDRTVNYPRFAARLGAAAAELVAAGRVDVVHAQGIAGLGYGRRRRRDSRLAAPLVTNPQGMEEHKTTGLKRLALGRLRALSREAAALSDRVIATDRATRGEVEALLGVDPARVVVLPNGVAPDAIARATPPEPRAAAERALPALAGAPLVLLSVGRLEAYKGFLDVLAALAALARRGALHEPWLWVAVGEGPLRAALGAEAERAGLAARVLLAGRVDEPLLHALYERADLFVHATRFEGSSLVTLEAMAHALPVVATRAGGIPDKVVEGETGHLVDPGDAAGLERAIGALARDPAARRRLGEAGRRLALESFAWGPLAARTAALYAELLRERAA